jgi:NADPH-dependent 2,4-dienoyl-CoA reductase/sulfur reductase-like enzyme
MAEKVDVAIIGGGPAGMTAASRIKRVTPKLRVVVFERSNYVSYAPCGIPYYLGGIVKELDQLVHYPLRVFTEERGIEVYTKTTVTELGTGYLRARNSDGEKTYEWNKLLIATGAKPKIPRVDGINLPGVFTLRTLEDGEAAKKYLQNVNTVAIVGGGYIGLELAENLKNLGKKVHLFELLPQVLPAVDPDVASLIEKELVSNGVDLHLGEGLKALHGKDKVESLETTKGEYRVEAVFIATGIAPETSLGDMIGVERGVTGALSVDKSMRTNVENVFAAGDVAEAINLVTGKPDWFPLAPVANKMGYVAGATMSGLPAEFPGAVGTSVTRVFSLEIGRTGLTEERARKEGFEPVSAKITSNSKASYIPGAGQVTVKLIADAKTGRLIGGQIIGKDVLARINTLAVLVAMGAQVEDAFFADLGYAPPFAPVWDPLIVAARVLMGKIRGKDKYF